MDKARETLELPCMLWASEIFTPRGMRKPSITISLSKIFFPPKR